MRLSPGPKGGWGGRGGLVARERVARASRTVLIAQGYERPGWRQHPTLTQQALGTEAGKPQG